MAETFPRSQLDVDRLYFCIPTMQWFSTPDGVGVRYYESREHGLEDSGADERYIGFINQPLADW